MYAMYNSRFCSSRECRVYECLFFALFCFFFNDTATTEIYTLSLHDALPIWRSTPWPSSRTRAASRSPRPGPRAESLARSRSEEHTSELSHGYISYAVFCLKKKKNTSNANYQKTNPYKKQNTHLSFSARVCRT